LSAAAAGCLGHRPDTDSPSDTTATKTATTTTDATAKLTNVSDEDNQTGNRRNYDIQYRGENGWRTTIGTESGAMWTDIGIEHPPGGGFTWEFTVSQDGFSDATDHPPTYHVCAPVEAGTYRSVYWGITTPKEAAADFETDHALGVEFTVTEAWGHP